MNTAQRVARNSLVPMAVQLVNKLVDAAFAIYVLRVIGPEGNGRYEFAVVSWLLLKTISDFGLGTLATREIARRPAAAGLWLGGGTSLRLLLLAGLLPLVGVGLAAYLAVGGLAPEAAAAVSLLALSIAPGALSEAATAVFIGRERMVTPALVTMLTTALRILVAGLALAAGAGVVGLAASAVVVNAVTALVLWRLVRPLAPAVRWWPGWATARTWLGTAWPLLLNGLLITLYFRLDVFVLQVARGEAAVGLYGAAYKFINLALIVPPYVTLALFPGLARQAERDPAALRSTLRRGVGYLTLLALPIVVATMALADWLILLLAGRDYLPGAADALRILIWFLPFSYANGLIQYGLIALDRQRAISGAFLLTLLFNLVANLALVPRYGTGGAALVTVLSELVLLGPLLRALGAALGDLRLAGVLWRPGAAAAVMALVIMATETALGPWPAVLLGAAAYLATLLALGAVGEEERRLLRALRGRP